jgi:hypothetical protein
LGWSSLRDWCGIPYWCDGLAVKSGLTGLQVWVSIPRLVGHIDQISLISLRNLIGLAGHIDLINLNGRVGQRSLASQVGLGLSGAIGKYDG